MKTMKMLLATTFLAMAVASPALAQNRDQGIQDTQNYGTYHGYPLKDWYRSDQW